MPTLAANGVRLHYELEGQGDTVLLLHPVGLDLACWDTLAGELRRGYRVLRVDLRGHGRSETPPPPYSLEGFAADVDGLLQQLGVASAHVVGLSMGGMVAQLLALDYPEDVLSLVLADTSSTLTPEGRRAMVARGEAAEDGGMKAVLQSTLERWFTPEFMGSEVVDSVRHRLLTDDVVGWAATWRAISELDTEKRLSEIQVPTLVMTGEIDVSAPVARAQAMASLIPGARLHIVPGAPHMAPLEAPERFNPPLIEFLERVAGPREGDGE